MKIKALIIFASLIFFCNTAYAVPGDVDPTFNGTGKVSFRYGLGSDLVFDVLTLPGGKTMVAGRTAFADRIRGYLVKYNQDGTTDNSFGIDGKFVWDVSNFVTFYSAAPTPDGRIVALSDYAVGMVNPDGTPDTGFGIGGIVQLPPGAYYKVRAQADGKILAGGVYVNGRASKIIFVRLNPNGSFDQSFGTGGLASLENRGLYEIFSDFEIDQSGGIVVVGQFKPKYDPAFTYATLAARFTPSGIVDTSFGENGRLILVPEAGSIGKTAALQSDGKIVVSGLSSATYPYGQRPFIMRCNANGTVDTSFNGGGVMFFQNGLLEQVRKIFPQPDGKMLVTADLPGLDSAVLRVNAGGGLDNTFGSRGMRTVPNLYVEGAALHSDGRLALGGRERYSIDLDINVVMLHSTAGFDTQFGAGGRVVTDVGEKKAFNAELLVQPDGKLISVGGNFGWFDIGIARFNVDGTPDRSFAGDGNIAFPGCAHGQRRPAALQGAKIVIACSDNFDHVLTRINSNGSLDTTFGVNGASRLNLAGKEPIRIAVLPDGKILSYASDNSGTGVFYRFDADGAPDNTFGIGGHVTASLPAGLKEVEAMIRQPDGKLLVGGSYRFNLQSKYRFMIARFNADGSPDTGFGFNGVLLADSGTEANETALVFILGADGKITAVGNRAKIAEPTRIEAARFTPDGQIDDTFGIEGFVFLRNQPDDVYDWANTKSAELQSDGKLVVYAHSWWLNGETTVRVDTAGNLDTGWGVGGWSPLALDVDAGPGMVPGTLIKRGADGKMMAVSSSSNVVLMRRLTTDENIPGPAKK